MYQKVIFTGNLGNEPDYKFLPNGNEVCNFSVASNRKTKSGDEKIWFSVSIYCNHAKPCADNLHKGSRVLVEGRLKPNEQGNPHTYTKGDGSVGSTYNVIAYVVDFLDSKPQADDDADFDDGVPW